MPLFSMLFGAGIVLAAERREAAGEAPGPFHIRRMGVLLVIALIHAYLVWYGDILFQYAICGALLFSFRKGSTRFLLGAGVLVLAGQPLMEMVAMSAPGVFDFVNTFQGMSLEEILAADLAAFRGPWTENLRMRALYTLEGQAVGFLLHGFWRSAGLILIGMGLYRAGVITGRRGKGTYWGFVAVGLLVALPVTAFAFWLNYSTGWSNFWIRQFGLQVIHWVGVLGSLGWLGAVILLSRSRAPGGMSRALAAVGRMALSNYLLQSLLCTFIFYGYGLGLYGSVERTGQMAVVAAIWIFQLLLSPLWLRRFHFGPAEWAWRSLSYGKVQPLRRAAT